MMITNRSNTRRAQFEDFSTCLLIGEDNTGSKEVSIQITDVEINGEQFMHSHKQEQCYFIISGHGLMTIDSESAHVKEGDAIFIPSNSAHGIKNIGQTKLTYLTANQSFGVEKEHELWSLEKAL